MPYGDSASLIRQFLTPMAPAFIRGKEQADDQDMRERQFGQEQKRYSETTGPYTQELTKQMQFANKKAEEAQRLYQTTMGGSADVSALLEFPGMRPSVDTLDGTRQRRK